MVNRQLREEEDPIITIHATKSGGGRLKDPMKSLGHRVPEKLEEGDFMGVVRLVCSEDSMADRSDATFMALKEKQSSPRTASYIPPAPDINGPSLSVSVDDVAQAIKSFPNGSSEGPDRLRSQHLMDMTNLS